MLTVDRLLGELGLELAAGVGADMPIRWVHSTELEDPTQWLSGGELILTTGLQLPNSGAQRKFVRRLRRHGCAGLGLGTGFTHQRLPRALVTEAGETGFPLFEVPYSMPFIAITERASSELISASYAMLRKGGEVHRRLEQLVLEERGLEALATALSEVVAGPVAVLDSREQPLAAAGGRPGPAAERLPVKLRGGRAHAWLVCEPGVTEPGEFQRLVLQQAATVVALELMRERAMRDTERRLAGDVLAEALTGRLGPDEVLRRLTPFGLGRTAAVALFAVDDPESALPLIEEVAAQGGPGAALVAVRDGLACAVVSDADPRDLARRARKELEASQGWARAAASRSAPSERLHRSFQEARWALEASARLNGRGPEVASHRDLGAFGLVLSLQEDDALRLFSEDVLGPLERQSGGYGEELIRSLEAFIEHNGQWESAARALFCHRHTLRYRIRKIEELTEKDLARAQDRIEFWLALKARELVG